MSNAGLRLNEVRALRCRDAVLRHEKDEPVGGFITIRQGWSHGEMHTPKTGQREVPISPELARELAPVMDGDCDGPIAVSHRGTPRQRYQPLRAGNCVSSADALTWLAARRDEGYRSKFSLPASADETILRAIAGHR